MSNLYADSDDCTNSSQNILAVYMTPRIVLTENLLIQQKGGYWFKTSVFMQCSYRVCARAHDSSMLMFVHGVPRVLLSGDLGWGEPREMSGTIRDFSMECC